VNSLSVHDFLMSRRGIRPLRKPSSDLLLEGSVSVVWISLMVPSFAMMRFVIVEEDDGSDAAAVVDMVVSFVLPLLLLPTVFSAQVEESTLQ